MASPSPILATRDAGTASVLTFRRGKPSARRVPSQFRPEPLGAHPRWERDAEGSPSGSGTPPRPLPLTVASESPRDECPGGSTVPTAAKGSSASYPVIAIGSPALGTLNLVRRAIDLATMISTYKSRFPVHGSPQPLGTTTSFVRLWEYSQSLDPSSAAGPQPGA